MNTPEITWYHARRLIVAMVVQAARDVRDRREDPYTASMARAWLLSQDCRHLCQMAEIDYNRISAWTRRRR